MTQSISRFSAVLGHLSSGMQYNPESTKAHYLPLLFCRIPFNAELWGITYADGSGYLM